MEKIRNLRVKRNNFSICVNDSGDCIDINLDDSRFIKKLEELADFGKNVPEIEEGDTAKIFEYTQKLSEMINDLFGPDSTFKIFGVYEPTLDLLAQFIDLLGPFITEASELKEASVKNTIKSLESRSKKRESVRG